MAISQDGTYYDDGGLLFDAFTAVLGSKTFLIEDFMPTEGSHFVQSNLITGSPRGGRDIADVITATATAQFPTGATLADTPTRFMEVTVPYRAATKVFVITEVGVPQKSGQENKVGLKLREKLATTGGGGGGS